MKKILEKQDELVAKWVAERIPMFDLNSSPYTAIGLANKVGGIIAGVIYQNFTRVDIHMHVASDGTGKWMNSRFLGEVFRYPFDQLGVRRVTGLVPESNVEARRFDEHLGFILEGRMRRMLPDGQDVLIYGMLREECRFLTVGLKSGYANRSDEFRRRA